MKKLLVLLLAIFISITNVSAESNFEYQWDNSDFDAWNTEVIIKTDDGFLLGGYDYDFYGHIVKFDKNGDAIDSITFDDEFTVVGLHVKDNHIYAAVLDDMWFVTIYKLDMELNIIDSVYTDYYLYDWNDIVYFGENGISLTTLGFYKFEGVADYDDTMYPALYVSYDFDTIEVIDWGTGSIYSTLKNLFPKKYEMMFDKYEDYQAEGAPIATDANDNMTVVVGKKDADGLTGGFITAYDKEGNILFNNVYGKAIWWYTDVIIYDEYILAIGTNYQYIDVYDFEGNLVEQIDVEKQYRFSAPEDIAVSIDKIIADGSGIVIAHQICDVVDNCAINCQNSLSRYEFKKPYKVYTKTDGNGIITPSTTEEYPDKEVTFVVTPNDGYKVVYVKVTDANGNEVVFPGNKFTMPHADVTIEAAFTIENPKTGMKIGLYMTGVLVISLLAIPLVTNRKKNNKLYKV